MIYKKLYKFRNIFAFLIVIVLLGSMFLSATPATAEELNEKVGSISETEPITEEMTLPEDDGKTMDSEFSTTDLVIPSEETIAPMDIGYGDFNASTVTVTSEVFYAPHPNVSASTGYTLSAGTTVYMIAREYDYFYIGWYIGSKMMTGYIPITSVSTDRYVWPNYDIFRPASCSATTSVLSFAGTTSNYIKIGEIYANENPLMVLGKYTVSGVIYYHVQYMTTDFKVKRGWVCEADDTITILSYRSTPTIDHETSYFSFINSSTGTAMTWDTNTNHLVQQTFTGSLEQTFILEEVFYDDYVTGYYRILSAKNPSMAVSVSSTGYSEGLPIVMTAKGHPNKLQEFMVGLTTYTDPNTNESTLGHAFYTRCTGEYRVISVFSGSNDLIQTAQTHVTTQCWRLKRVQEPWAGTYGYGGGTSFPGTYKVYVDESIKSFFTIEDIATCVNRWNSAYNRLSLQTLNATGYLTNGFILTNDCLALVKKGTATESNTYGKCIAYQRNGSTFTMLDADDEASGGYNKNINMCIIEIYTDNLGSHIFAEQKKTLIHELGHALKLTHTYMELFSDNGEYRWIQESQHLTIMDQGKFNLQIPTELDCFRLKKKWDTIS